MSKYTHSLISEFQKRVKLEWIWKECVSFSLILTWGSLRNSEWSPRSLQNEGTVHSKSTLISLFLIHSLKGEDIHSILLREYIIQIESENKLSFWNKVLFIIWIINPSYIRMTTTADEIKTNDYTLQWQWRIQKPVKRVVRECKFLDAVPENRPKYAS